MEQIDRALDVNLRAPILLAHALIPGMVERGRGHLVFISSMSGKVATTESALYSATKYGLRGFASGLRQDLRGSGIGVSAIFPGPIAEAGMFAQTGGEAAARAGIRSPRHVGARSCGRSSATAPRSTSSRCPRACGRGRRWRHARPMATSTAGRARGDRGPGIGSEAHRPKR